MGLIIDVYYVIRELIKLSLMVVISPLGLFASYLVTGNTNS
jgi:hypothetical protein